MYVTPGSGSRSSSLLRPLSHFESRLCGIRIATVFGNEELRRALRVVRIDQLFGKVELAFVCRRTAESGTPEGSFFTLGLGVGFGATEPSSTTIEANGRAASTSSCPARSAGGSFFPTPMGLSSSEAPPVDISRNQTGRYRLRRPGNNEFRSRRPRKKDVCQLS
jgi:hypothetical protein